MIHDFVPWTRELREGELDFRGHRAPVREILAEQRRDLVLKPERGSQGEGVVVGRFTAAETWRQHCATALEKGDYVVQEYLESRPYLGQKGETGYGAHDAVWGLFCFAERYGGGFLRFLPRHCGDGVINSARGAVEGILFEV